MLAGTVERSAARQHGIRQRPGRRAVDGIAAIAHFQFRPQAIGEGIASDHATRRAVLERDRAAGRLAVGGGGLLTSAPYGPFAVAVSSTLFLFCGIYQAWTETLALIALHGK